MCHGWCSAAKDEEEHASPGYDVQAVDGDDETDWCNKVSPETTKSDGGGLPFGVLGRKLIAIGIGYAWVMRCDLDD